MSPANSLSRRCGLLTAFFSLLAVSAQAHLISSRDVPHDWTVRVKQGVVEIGFEARFSGEAASDLRSQMDADGNARLTPAEVRTFAIAHADEWTSGVVLYRERERLKLTWLHPPRIDLGGADHTGPAPLHIRLGWFSRGADPALYFLDDLLWQPLPAMLSLRAEGDPSPRVVQPAGGHQHARPNESRYLAFQIEAPAWQRGERHSMVDLGGAVEFLGRLVTDQAYRLLDAGHQAELEELNRRLQEALEEMRMYYLNRSMAGTPDRVRGLLARLYELIEESGRLIEVELEPGHFALPPAGPFELPGDVGAVVLRARMDGLDETRFRIHDFSFAAPDPLVAARIDVATTGTTWVLLNLRDVPPGGCRTIFEIGTDRGKGAWRIPIEVVPPEPARLSLRVEDEEGDTPPFMVRLRWLLDLSDRQPPNAIDLAPQFENQGWGGNLRPSYMPGVMSEPHWCVPGPFEMPLPPGDYALDVRRGIEYLPVAERLRLESGERVEKTIRLRRWVDMPARGWWSGDDHAHVQVQTDEDATRALTWARAEDVHVANILEMSSIARLHFVQRGFGSEFRMQEGDYALVPGQESPRTHFQLGHALALNILARVAFPDRYFLYDLVFDEVHRQGGLTGYAHVINEPMFDVDRDMTLNLPKGKIDFLEVMQKGEVGTTLSYDFLNLGFRTVFSAGSDVPYGGSLGEARTYVQTGNADALDVDAWFAAFRAGRTFVTNGLMLELSVEGAGPGEEVRVDSPGQLSIKARAWGAAGYTVPARLEIVRLGKVVEAAKSGDEKIEELTIDVRVDAGHGGWIAARTTGHDGTQAHTTPVWVVRPPLRPWDHEAVPGLIHQRLACLEEIESLIRHARHLDQSGALEESWTPRGFPWLIDEDIQRDLAQQGDDLMERIQAAREIYGELLRLHEQETPLRARP